MKRIVVAVMEDAPSYWSALFDDGSTEQLDATGYSAAVEEADQRFGAGIQDQLDLEEDIG